MRETGDKAFIMDMESDQVFMLMNLDEYESLIGLDSLADEASDDDEDDSPLGDYILDDIIDAPEKSADKKEVTKEIVMKPIKEIIKETFKPTQSDSLPITIEPMGESGLVQPDLGPKTMAETSANEESIKDVPNDGEEEKFYLEPLE